MTYYLSVTMHLEYIAYLASFDPHSGAVIFKIESKSTFSCVPANWSKTNKQKTIQETWKLSGRGKLGSIPILKESQYIILCKIYLLRQEVPMYSCVMTYWNFMLINWSVHQVSICLGLKFNFLLKNLNVAVSQGYTNQKHTQIHTGTHIYILTHSAR